MIPLLIAILALIGLFNIIIVLFKSIFINALKYFNKRKNSIINFVFCLMNDSTSACQLSENDTKMMTRNFERKRSRR